MLEELYFTMGLATIIFLWLRNRFRKPDDVDMQPLSPMSVCSEPEVDEKYMEKQLLRTAPLESPNWDSLLESENPSLSPVSEHPFPFTVHKSPSWSSGVEELHDGSGNMDLLAEPSG